LTKLKDYELLIRTEVKENEGLVFQMKRVNFESKRIQEDYQFLMKTREQEKAIVKDCESLILAKKNENAELWNELKLANLELQKR
jgi:hypothetical protein